MTLESAGLALRLGPGQLCDHRQMRFDLRLGHIQHPVRIESGAGEQRLRTADGG